jgi:RNA polymerase sigma-70 factor (ECF subfamily)
LDSLIHSLSDEDLARQTRAGSRRSFEELIARYDRRLRVFLRPKIGSDQDIEDIIQETFLKLYRNIESYDSRWKFSTWVYTAAGRLAISHFRTQSRGKRLEAAARTALDPFQPPSKGGESSPIWEAARALRPSQYQAFWLRHVEGLNVKEIAGIMKKSPLAVRLLLHRARLHLADLIGTSPRADGSVLPTANQKMNAHFKENTG